jgi:hypothetical protein
MWKIASSPGTYAVRARARSSKDRSVVSGWSGAISVSIAEKPFVHVISPSGSETWVVGATHTISWDQGYLDQTGTIYVFYSYGGSWHPIANLQANSTTTSYDWTIPDMPPGLGSVIPRNRVTTTAIWIGNWVNGEWQCWDLSKSLKILDNGWVFTISGVDKGGATFWFDQDGSSFDGYGISLNLGMFRIQGSYTVDTKGVISGTYLINDFGSLELGSGNITGSVDLNGTKLTLKLNRLNGDHLFNMSGIRLLGEPAIPANWTGKISGNIQGNFSSLTFEPFQDPVCGGDCAHIFKVSGSGTLELRVATSLSIDGCFFFTPLKTLTGNAVYGIYDHLTIGRSDEPGYFSGTLNPNSTKGKFSFKAVSDSGDKYTFSGQVVPP